MNDLIRAAAGRLRRYREIANQGTPTQRAAYSDSAGVTVYLGTAFDRAGDESLLAAWACETIASTPAFDDEPADPDWLAHVGFRGGNDESNVDVFDLVSNGLTVRVCVRWRNHEILGSSLGISLKFDRVNVEITRLGYQIGDDPTRGDVRQLCMALGIPLKE